MSRRGFTLIEMLIAIALVIALVGALFAFFLDTLDSRDRLASSTAELRDVGRFFDALDRDLSAASGVDGKGGPGLTGTATSIRISTRGVPIHRVAQSPRDPALSDAMSVAWTFDELPRTLTAVRDDSDRATLSIEPTHVRFRYHDGDAWQDQFTSTGDRGLPVAIEVALWFTPWPDDPTEEEREAMLEAEEAGAGDLDIEAFDGAEVDDGPPPPPPDRVRVFAIPDAQPRADRTESFGP